MKFWLNLALIVLQERKLYNKQHQFSLTSCLASEMAGGSSSVAGWQHWCDFIWIISLVLGTGASSLSLLILSLIILYQVTRCTATQIPIWWKQLVQLWCSTCALAKEIILFMVWVLGSLNKHVCLCLLQKKHMALVALNVWDFRNAHCLWQGWGDWLFLRETSKLLVSKYLYCVAL